MLGISYGELFLIIGATAAVIGPRDLPRIARTAGRLAGRAIGYVQLARGQFDNIMQQTQARQVHKELQDTMSQLEAIRHEIRSISFMNPGPITRNFVDNITQASSTNETTSQETIKESPEAISTAKDTTIAASASSDLHSQATAYAKLVESTTKSVSMSNEMLNELTDESGLVVLPVSAKSAGLLPPTNKDGITGSDIVLEAVLEADVARNAKNFFAQPQIQMKSE